MTWKLRRRRTRGGLFSGTTTRRATVPLIYSGYEVRMKKRTKLQKVLGAAHAGRKHRKITLPGDKK